MGGRVARHLDALLGKALFARQVEEELAAIDVPGLVSSVWVVLLHADDKTCVRVCA